MHNEGDQPANPGEQPGGAAGGQDNGSKSHVNLDEVWLLDVNTVMQGGMIFRPKDLDLLKKFAHRSGADEENMWRSARGRCAERPPRRQRLLS